MKYFAENLVLILCPHQYKGHFIEKGAVLYTIAFRFYLVFALYGNLFVQIRILANTHCRLVKDCKLTVNDL